MYFGSGSGYRSDQKFWILTDPVPDPHHWVCRILAGEEVCDIYSMHYSDVHRNGPLQTLTQIETKKRGS
jgi:hypothetical protein